ncbi:sugar transferase [Listeria newyorkensis]|uniref:Sugar transferase n=1 Tax=Listeria newyorkensis TaxID=1497681 RepID=A0A841YWA5_9LIST|nr:sugar transferase [Listeria newyorkensis]MBC1457379.1 sugar transferase [Listeria newyorkensis]
MLRIKTVIDTIVASMAIVILCIPMAILTLVLAIYYKGNPIYMTQRPGLHGDAFRLYKFKSMKELYDDEGNLLSNEQRLTRVGSLLRKTSIDELPQLINVVKGDMSLVGPRPLLLEYNDLYTEEERQRLNMKPGITGWAQVNGRNEIDWKTKFQMDVAYVTQYSLLFDIKIILLTIKVIIKKEGVSQDGFVSAERYRG